MGLTDVDSQFHGGNSVMDSMKIPWKKNVVWYCWDFSPKQKLLFLKDGLIAYATRTDSFVNTMKVTMKI